METIAMSARERRRMTVMTRVTGGSLKLSVASEMMRVTYRQGKRILRRYREGGDAGLVHLGRGRRSNRRRPDAEQKRAVSLYNAKYPDFGPLLASEHLAADHRLIVDHETLRRWLVAAGSWRPRQKREVHRAARERRPRRGDLVQIDGSEHDWFEGRGKRLVLMVMVDDATNMTLARFYAGEDTAAAYDIFERYLRLYGLPAALYPDRDSIYVCTRDANLEEELANLEPETQFARAMGELGVDLFPAYSPQAKGRVERRHGLFQDRLVKEMRLLGISTMEAANEYLDKTFLDFVNGRYIVKAADPANGHRPRPSATTLAMVLTWQTPRSVAKDWTIRWHNQRLQIDARHKALDLPGRRVTVIKRRDSTLAIRFEDRMLTFRDAPAPTLPIRHSPVLQQSPRMTQPPADSHPWRRRSVQRRRFYRPPPTSYNAHSRGAENLPTAMAYRSATTK